MNTKNQIMHVQAEFPDYAWYFTLAEACYETEYEYRYIGCMQLISL